MQALPSEALLSLHLFQVKGHEGPEPNSLPQEHSGSSFFLLFFCVGEGERESAAGREEEEEVKQMR